MGRQKTDESPGRKIPCQMGEKEPSAKDASPEGRGGESQECDNKTDTQSEKAPAGQTHPEHEKRAAIDQQYQDNACQCEHLRPGKKEKEFLPVVLPDPVT